MMKQVQKTFCLMLVFFCLLGGKATLLAQEVLLYDSFDYPVGSALGGQGSWSNPSSSTTLKQVFVTDGNLTYGNLKSSEGKTVTLEGAGHDPTFYLDPVHTDNWIYYSLVFKVSDMSNVADNEETYFAGFLSEGGSYAGTLWIRKSGDGFNLGFNTRYTSEFVTWNTEVYPLNQNIFVVGGFDRVPGSGNDNGKLWVNPAASSVGGIEPAAVLETGPTGSDLLNVGRFALRQDSDTATPTIQIDEVRVGLTWESVTPAATTTGIVDDTKGLFSVYPNPVQGQGLRFTLPEQVATQKMTMSVWSIAGKKLLESTGSQEAVQQLVNEKLAAFPAGMLLLKLETGGKSYQTKLVKQ